MKTERGGRLNHADLCRLSRLFNERANLELSQDMRINEWLKEAIAELALPPRRRGAGMRRA
jgi:hypothetical protein